jgi:hypothetical protein
VPISAVSPHAKVGPISASILLIRLRLFDLIFICGTILQELVPRLPWSNQLNQNKKPQQDTQVQTIPSDIGTITHAGFTLHSQPRNSTCPDRGYYLAYWV